MDMFISLLCSRLFEICEDDDDSIDTDALDDDIANDQWNKLVFTVF